MTDKNVPATALTMPEGILRDPASIDVNRRGLVSTAQRAALDNVASQATWAVFLLLAGGAIIGAIVWMLAPDYPLIALLPVLALALLGLPYIRRLVLLWRAQREARAGPVQQALGRVVVGGTRRTIEALGVTLNSTALGSLVPGSYRFYYLPRSGWLLSAQALGANAETPAPSLAEGLAAAYQTIPGDLLANHAGGLSPAQARRIQREAVETDGVGLVVIVPVAVFFAWWSFQTLQGVLARTSTVSSLCQPGVMAAITVTAAAYYLRQGYLLLADLRGKRVTGVERILYKTSRPGGRGTVTYTYYTGTAGGEGIAGEDEARFDVSHAAYDALEPGRWYRLYHLPRTRKVVAVEPVETPAGQPAEAQPAAGSRPRRTVKRR